jgi:hypothetical protein
VSYRSSLDTAQDIHGALDLRGASAAGRERHLLLRSCIGSFYLQAAIASLLNIILIVH